MFGSWCRPHFACWILHRQRQRDMEPSLRTLKGPDQTFSNWVCGDYEARKQVISHLFLHVSSTQMLTFLSPLNWSLLLLSLSLWVHLILFLYRMDCGFHTLEYLAKWEGRRVPFVTAAMVIELRKIYTWNWLTNENFNTHSNAREFIEEDVKKVTKKCK